MRQFSIHFFSLFSSLFIFFGYASLSHAQPAEPDVVRLKTGDGLNLWGKWFAGGKGQKSDAVILVHAYGSDSSKGPWEPLAKALQKEGYSVLMFDLRGHGKSADFKVMDSAAAFTMNNYNKYAGFGLNPKLIKEIKRERFSPNYYPFLINDIAAARMFIDQRNDGKECNAGRVFVIAETNICPLVMMWLTTEFKRCGVGPAVRGAAAKDYLAGRDIAGAVFLSWSTGGGVGTSTALTVADRVLKEKCLYSDVERVIEQLRDKVAMAFIFGKEDKGSASEANRWFTSYFRIPVGKKDDKEKVKYIVEVAGAEKLTGIKLLEVMESRKFKEETVVMGEKKEVEVEKKVSIVEGQILAFMKATKDKGINGTSNGPMRYVENYDLIPVPLEMWGLRAP